MWATCFANLIFFTIYKVWLNSKKFWNYVSYTSVRDLKEKHREQIQLKKSVSHINGIFGSILDVLDSIMDYVLVLKFGNATDFKKLSFLLESAGFSEQKSKNCKTCLGVECWFSWPAWLALFQ